MGASCRLGAPQRRGWGVPPTLPPGWLGAGSLTVTSTHPAIPAPSKPHLGEVHILCGGQPEASLGALVGQ